MYFFEFRNYMFLNHFYLVVNKKLYQELVTSFFLRNIFAICEERTTINKSMKWKGFYIYGKNTYFEFFEDGALPGRKEGSFGLAIGTEKSDGLEEELSLTFKHQGFEEQIYHRQTNGKDIPWFHYLGIETQMPPFSQFWFIDYMPTFIQKWPESKDNINPSILRKDILDQYKIKVMGNLDFSERILKDVVEMDIELSSQQSEQLSSYLSLTDFSNESDGDIQIFKSSNIQFNIKINNNNPIGLARFLFETNKNHNENINFNNQSQIIVKGNLGEWSFPNSGADK